MEGGMEGKGEGEKQISKGEKQTQRERERNGWEGGDKGKRETRGGREDLLQLLFIALSKNPWC